MARKFLLTAASAALAACTPLAAPGTPVEGPVALGQTAYAGGPSVTPLGLLEDSRCPKDVECVWAGQVRVRARVAGGGWSREVELISNKPVAIADGQLQLVAVTPERLQHRTIAPKDYRFTFRFDGGL